MSVPYYDILMHRKAGAPIPDAALPEGFRFVFYKPGDEKAWALIETSVLEFPDDLDALLYLQNDLMRHPGELERRCLFIENEKGEKVGTATAWWSYTGTRRDPWIHWVAVIPQYQGKGLGNAVMSRILHLMSEIEGDRDFYLHTQTWSHRAVRIYRKMGFSFTEEKGLGGYSNENYEKAMALLQEIYSTK